MEFREKEEEEGEGGGDRLINEAVKRILLDVIIRGHGDKLIGRWSREPDLQNFLEQVPYMLDRINQLHLACTRVEASELEHNHHYHQHHTSPLLSGHTSLNDFVSLIGNERHWLVRTRDTLGLTPLHKAVLFNNRPIVEYILDRYPDELAASSWRNQKTLRVQQPTNPPVTRLIDAQDKYGRSATHYAAASQNQQLYQFLLSKGASLSIHDFKGKSAAYYLRHPNQLRSKSIIHLANKLNANYQANVLSRTLRAASSRAPIEDADCRLSFEEPNDHSVRNSSRIPDNNRESLSISCGNLASEQQSFLQGPVEEKPASTIKRSHSTLNNFDHFYEGFSTKVNRATLDKGIETEHTPGDPTEIQLTPSDSPSSLSSDHNDQRLGEYSIQLKQLIADRCSRLIIEQSARQRVRNLLKDGVIDKINELLISGYGHLLIHEEPNYCWNLQCKKYIRNVVPQLLDKVDRLHESVASNQLASIQTLINDDPILTRIKRPYKRAWLNVLHLAVQLDRRTIVKHLLAQFPEMISQRDSNGATCLHLAAKSLKCDRLYFWLCEHFGSLLEHLRDNRNKTAANYRQQAIRMSSFDFHPNVRPKDLTEQFLQQNQSKMNDLTCTGTRIKLKSKFHRMPGKKDPIENEANKMSDLNAPKEPDKTIDYDSPSPKLQLEENDNLPPTDSDSSLLHRLTMKPVRRDSAQSLIILGGRRDLIESERRYSDSGRADLQNGESHKGVKFLFSSEASREHPLTSRSSTAEIKSEPSEFLLGELALLDLTDQEEFSGDQREDQVRATYENTEESPLTTPSLPVSRPQSASMSGKLDTIIQEALFSGDLKKLEHLILAGCGKRLLESYETLRADSTNKSLMSRDVRDFVESKTPAYMDNIERIHQVLHGCYATWLSDQEKFSDVNQTFHKLCTLLNRRRLIMSRDSSGASPLHVALIRSDKRLVDYCVRRHPEAASAPDNETRNALHFAALVLNTFNHHGSFKLTNMIHDEAQVKGYWEVDETCQTIWENLRRRYSELLDLKDRNGKKAIDYLESETEHPVDHEEHRSRLVPASIIENCCSDYAKLLQRYNYCFMIDPPAGEESLAQYEPDQSEAHKDLNTGNSSKELESANQNKNKPAKPKPASVKDNDFNFDHLNGTLPSPIIPLEDSSFRQVAPKPTVGSSVGYPLSPIQRQHDSEASTFFAGSSCTKDNKRPRPSGNSLLSDLELGTRHRHHRYGHHRHNHNHNHKRQPSALANSIVGGVIVPTIIHNDKMDEIETYDIIYRQPTTSAVLQESSSGSSSSFSSIEDRIQPAKTEAPSLAKTKDLQSSSSSDELDDEDDRVERLSNEFESRVRREKSELKAKVDQIMLEIKSSAKSGKSSRFLGSAHDDGQRRGGPTVMFALASSTSSKTASPSSSASSTTSSGHSSARTSASSNCSTRDSCSSFTGSLGQSSRISSASNSMVQQNLDANAGIWQQTAAHKATASISDLASQLVSKNTYGQTYLHFIASKSQSSTTLYKVLSHGSHLIGERDIFYRTARDVALQFNLSNNVQVLDKFVIDLFISNNTSLLRHLLNQGYSPLIHVSDSDGNDIMLILKLLKLDKMIQFLLQMADFQRWRDELHTFIRHGYSAGVTELIKRHVDLIRAKSIHSRSSLHLAVLFERLEMVSELLAADPSSVHCLDNMGRSALHYAFGLSPSPHMETIRDKLLACGANADLRDVKMRTPKYYYIFRKEVEDIRRIELELN